MKTQKLKLFVATWMIAATALSVGFIGCADKRSEQFAQGQGQDLTERSSLENQSFPVKITGSRVQAQSAATDVSLNGSVSSVKAFQLLKYETPASLLGDVPMTGLPGAKYEIRYLLTPKYLKVVKVGNKSDIPYSEQSYAETLPDGRLAVPMVGYSVSYYRIENQLNGDREQTRTLIQVEEADSGRASHLKIDYKSREVFEAVRKLDVYPANLFDGEWYYSETIIDTSVDKTTDIGNIYQTMDSHLDLATKVRFAKTKGSLRAVNLNIDERLNKKDEINYSTVLELPVEWKEYRAKRSGADRSMQEEEVTTNPELERPFMQTRFEEVRTVALSSGVSTSLSDEKWTQYDPSKENKLVDLEITDDYVGFTIFRVQQGVRVKYSFLKAGVRDYQPRRAYKEDRKKFGFFTTERPELLTYKMYRKEDFEKNVLLSRFNPKAEKVVFHFSKGTPQWIRPVGRKAAEEWDRAFKAAGSKIRVVLDESFDAGLGDLRYNVINLIESVTGNGGLFGFGPMISDPKTGEIISATANVHITPIQEKVISMIRRLVAREVGLWKGKDISSPVVPADAWESTINERSQGLQYKSEADQSWQAVKEVIADVSGKVTYKPFKFVDKKGTEKPDPRRTSRGCHDSSIGMKYLDLDIQKQCPEVVSYIERLKSSGQIVQDDEVEVLDSCSRKVMQEKVLSVLIHEMGHNFGLRHNFVASNDAANFYSSRETGTADPVRSSSIMEYTAFDEDRLIQAGKYDIAAIRFGYADQVELKDGSFVSVANRSISDATAGKEIRPYRFCTDEDVSYRTNPMCQRHDAGVTPEEVVDHQIHEIKQLIASSNYRYDRAFIRDSDDVAAMIGSRLYEMKMFYDEFRFKFREFYGSKSQYLEPLSEEGFSAALSKMEKDPRFGDDYRKWRPAAVKVYQFLRELVDLPNRYCVVAEEVAPRKFARNVIELKKIREELYRLNYSSPKTCRDPEVTNYLAQRKSKLLEEVGLFIDDTRYSMRVEDMPEPYDVLGMQGARRMAGLIISARFMSSLKHANLMFFPNMMDEPAFRSETLNSQIGRVFNGLSLKTESGPLKNLKRFSDESDLLEFMNGIIKKGLIIPGNGVISGGRLSMFKAAILPNDSAAKVQGALTTYDQGAGVLACLSESWRLCPEVIKVLKSIDVRLRNPGTAESVAQWITEIKAKLPATDSIEKVNAKDLSTHLEVWNAGVEALPGMMRVPEFLPIAQKVDGMLALVNAAAEKAGVQSDEELEEFIQKLSLKSLGLTAYPLNQKDLGGLAQSLSGKIPEMALQYDLDARDVDEFRVQRELLQSLLWIP